MSQLYLMLYTLKLDNACFSCFARINSFASGVGWDLPCVLVGEVVVCGGPGSASAVAWGVDGFSDQRRAVRIAGETFILPFVIVSLRISRDPNFPARWISELPKDLVEAALPVSMREGIEDCWRDFEGGILLVHKGVHSDICLSSNVAEAAVANRDGLEADAKI